MSNPFPKFKIKLLIFFFISINLVAQISKEEIQRNLTGIKSIENSDNDFTGYDALSKAIGNTQIVMLGEQTHGHGRTFTAKIKIIEYLVREKGFDVVAFESGFYELNKLWETESDLDTRLSRVRSEIYPDWSAAKELDSFFQLVKKNNQSGGRLAITGFDCKHDMPYGQKEYLNDFINFIDKNNLRLKSANDFRKFEQLLKGLITLKTSTRQDVQSRPSSKDEIFFYSVIDSLSREINQLQSSDEVEFWKQEMVSLKMQARNTWVASGWKGASQLSVRDSAMAQNIIWLANNKYKGRKIIVWAASYHIAKEKQVIAHFKSDSKKNELMGNLLNLKLPGRTYSLGFISSDGSYGEWFRQKFYTYKVNRTQESFEKKLSLLTDAEFAFINMTGVQNENPFLMAGVHFSESKAVWNKVFDGLFYIRTMKPATYLSK